MQPTIIIVSNRLPVSVKKTDEELTYYPSVGGLATGLSSYVTDKHNTWIGWPGIPNEELTEGDKVAITNELAKHNCYPVFLSKKQLDEYYNGFSNSVLWPLLHNLPVTDKRPAAWWKAYRAVNQQFADTVAAVARPHATVWVHDYQLLLLPELLRGRNLFGHIGFFSHIPFPPATVFTALPEARQLTSGVLGASLIGFHTPSYVRNFLHVCQELDSGIVSDRSVISPGHVATVADFPMGIDYGKFTRATRSRAVRTELRRYQRQYRGRKVILTVDRLDPTKGLVERLRAHQSLLKAQPELRNKVVMIMLAMPSRTEIAEYQKLKQDVEALVAKINDTYGTPTWSPVDYQFTSLPFEQLSALYQLADVAFIAPIRDGMNLVAKEYVASKSTNGVLILSSTAGAAEELHDALIVDPARPKTLVTALHTALTMRPKELRRRLHKMQTRLAHFTVHEWAGTFMSRLNQPVQGTALTHTLSPARRKRLTDAYHQARKRLILLDYDGVLAPYVSDPAKAEPSAAARQAVERLAGDKANEVVIVSGRRKSQLEAWWGDLPIALAAEHGALYRRAGGKHWHTTSEAGKDWKRDIAAVMEHYASITPGAFVEAKDWSIVWHYRTASPYYAQKHLVTLKRLLRPLLKPDDLLMQDGRKILEVKPRDFNKGLVAREWLIRDHDFIMALGDDVTDEDTFAALPAGSYSIRVGRGRTEARYRIADTTAAITLLSDLSR